MTEPMSRDSKLTNDELAAEEYAGLTSEMKKKAFYVHDTMQGNIDAFLAGSAWKEEQLTKCPLEEWECKKIERQLRASLAEAVAGLEKYARHPSDCNHHYKYLRHRECECGLEELTAKLRASGTVK